MKINEVEQLNEGVGDWMRAAAYNKLGIGGEKGNQAATMYKFTDGLKQQLSQTANAAAEAGMKMDYKQFIDSYLAKYGWTATNKQKKALLKMVNDPSRFAKGMYVVGMNQVRDNYGRVINRNPNAGATGARPRAGKGVKTAPNAAGSSTRDDTGYETEPAAQSTGGAGAFGSMAGQLSGETPSLSNKTQQLISAIQNLRGADNLDDLASITKAAMQVLYSQDKSTYNELYKEIMTGQKGPGTMADAFAARRAEKQKAAAKAANASATPFSRLPTAASTTASTPEPEAVPAAKSAPTSPDDIAARRIAKQKAATAALNGPASTRVPSMSADDLAARRIAKQKAAAAALNMK